MRLAATCATSGLAASLALLGCGRDAEPAAYVPIVVEAPSRDAQGGPNAFDAYVKLAGRAVSASVQFDQRDTPDARRRALAELEPLLEELAEATALPCSFRYSPVPPFEPRPHHEGWLVLGRAVVWRAEAATNDQDWPEAVRWTVVATTFGIDLGGGAAADASLGYGILDAARAVIGPHLPTMPAEELESLADGLSAALLRLPEAEQTLGNEGAAMLASVKALQDAHRDGTLGRFAKGFHQRSRRAVEGLQSLDGAERQAFFRSLLDERESVLGQLKERSVEPAFRRGPVKYGLSGDLRVLASQFFKTGEPWMSMRDLSVARTRLLTVTAFLDAQIAATGAAPPNLGGIKPTLCIDPYTHHAFGYLPRERGFLVYSYGTDGKDDRGDTDGERTSPDVLLEDAAL
ncbi:MAG: hypothetical protein IH945_04975 [Armatimonadetes bacterium]|nr:hypothetical protein [Armatimonadota bacterium]